ncbi:MAG: non-canonical purine NTP pyrophosphatase [Actinomycetota bacterium]
MTYAPVPARLVLATRNEHKVIELRQILAGVLLAHWGADRAGDTQAMVDGVVGIDAFDTSGGANPIQEVIEEGVTFAANALLKAHAVSVATGLPALADDSGLAVDVLGGCPGIFSARWSGLAPGTARAVVDQANIDLLLAQLADVPDQHRAAAFMCAIAVVTPDGVEQVEQGELRGRIGRESNGDNGFGYDPIFFPDASSRTLAQHSPAEKNAISHRARAIRAIAPKVITLL